MVLSYAEQVNQHLDFLRSQGLDADVLELCTKDEYVRCREIDSHGPGRGELAYQTRGSILKNGWYGLSTRCRCADGSLSDPFRTYGHHPSTDQINHSSSGVTPYHANSSPADVDLMPQLSDESESKSRYLWDRASDSGCSDYLTKKGVGAHGIRFMSNNYGRVALVPACDLNGHLRAIQFLNPNGEKRFVKGSKISKLFHPIGNFSDGKDIGVAESYVTASTCFELTGIPVLCAFSSSNILAVARIARMRYPNSRIVIFADNDRHLPENKGVLEAEKILPIVDNTILATPEFGGVAPSNDASDWNDLARIFGVENAKEQIKSILQ